MKVDNRRAAEILDHANDARDGGCLCGECGGSIREREDLLSDRAEIIEVVRNLLATQYADGAGVFARKKAFEAAKALLASADAEGEKRPTHEPECICYGLAHHSHHCPHHWMNRKDKP